jgi:DMSO/TMAO reductase YedYZ molybdopterin-dependent catalytic subunit
MDDATVAHPGAHDPPVTGAPAGSTVDPAGSTVDATEAPPAPPAGPPRWTGALAGLTGAGVALAFGELVSGFSDRVPSLVVAVGDVFVDKTPGDLVEVGIQAAGTNDKPILLWTIVVASLAVGALLGRVAQRSRRLGDAGFLAFGVIGAWAAHRDTTASGTGAIVTAIVAALLGTVTVRTLLGVAALRDVRVRTDGAVTVAPAAFPGRRAFLGLTGAAAATAIVSGIAGRALRSGRSVEALRRAVALPPASGGAGAAAGAAPAVVAAATPAGVLDTVVKDISPYVTPNARFYRIDTALVVPQVDPTSWKLKIGGLVDRPFELTYDDLLGMELVDETVTLACVSNDVGGKYVGNAVWRGVPLTTLLDRAGARRAGTQIAGISVDGFDASFPTELAYDGRTAMLAVGMNGEPLPVDHGFPARLVIAGLYGYVSAVKWLREIRVVDAGYDAYWIPRGWSKLGPIKTQSRIDVPRTGRVTAGTQAIAGVAWAPGTGVAKVEVQVDDGPWRECTLGDATSDETWVQWMLPWDATPGRHRVRVRATDTQGRTQSGTPVDPAPDGAEGWHTVTVTVA